ncbi:hypothetical protein N752_14180 [Desulforamulus aquiferis]|nr:hypothetical protein N752_14180 [Desulforamulus aquiferis]
MWTLPARLLIKQCFSGKYNEEQMLTYLNKEGGMYSYLGTKDVRKALAKLAEGDQKTKLVLEAMCYQIAKEIGAMSTVLYGQVDRIVLTGGLAHSQYITDKIIERVSFIAPVMVAPGEEEMESLALGA